ncbi:MAG: 4Fe-4S dicluster domain-containing protein [Muribaculaceae bacterium]|nr:4Fe-4S dicluster domain-containing protein [Muribaculaceae bacterium]
MKINEKTNSKHTGKKGSPEKSLKVIRRILAAISILLITPLFLDFTGTWQAIFGWMAKIQFLPALLSLNVIIILALIIITLLLGRLYCSVICPLGIMQDGFGWLGKKAKKNRYSYSAPKNILRYIFLGIMVIAIVAGLNSMVALLAPYSAYGRIVSSILKPVYIWGNNILASWAEQNNSYAFYQAEYWTNGYGVLVVAAVTLVALAILAWRNGRTYCNTICPVGTVLGFFSRFSLFRIVLDKSKCVDCKLCSRNCKASCIDIPNHEVDYSRCVTCFDCIGKCNKGALSYIYVGIKNSQKTSEPEKVDGSRRQFLSTAAILGTTAAVTAADKTVDGGLAAIEDKKIPERKTRIVPPGAISLRNLHTHCTSCQLCVSACPNGVLRPMTDFENFMQPESSYERGYCRPECTRCSDVCPTGAIRPLDTSEKSSIQIGHAVWVKANCVPVTDGVECGNCARHCPTGAITMVESESGLKIPAVNTERCIGCGACENLCPARPFSAIYVEGHENHRII